MREGHDVTPHRRRHPEPEPPPPRPLHLSSLLLAAAAAAAAMPLLDALTGHTDPAKKLEHALAKEAKSDANHLSAAAKALQSTEKAHARAQKVRLPPPGPSPALACPLAAPAVCRR